MLIFIKSRYEYIKNMFICVFFNNTYMHFNNTIMKIIKQHINIKIWQIQIPKYSSLNTIKL